MVRRATPALYSERIRGRSGDREGWRVEDKEKRNRERLRLAKWKVTERIGLHSFGPPFILPLSVIIPLRPRLRRPTTFGQRASFRGYAMTTVFFTCSALMVRKLPRTADKQANWLMCRPSISRAAPRTSQIPSYPAAVPRRLMHSSIPTVPVVGALYIENLL